MLNMLINPIKICRSYDYQNLLFVLNNRSVIIMTWTPMFGLELGTGTCGSIIHHCIKSAYICLIVKKFTCTIGMNNYVFA